MIAFAAPGAFYAAHADAVAKTLARVAASGWYVLGPEVEGFESAFADWCGVAHGVGVASGTDAVHLALRGLGIGPGDEVIAPALTALPTIAAIDAAGAVPVLADIDPATATLDPGAAAAAITPRTRALVAVHLYGRPADLSALGALAARHGLALVEDAAQAHGARWHGRRVGGVGHAGCFSFYPTKNLGAMGDGGMVVTGDPALADRIRRLRQYGWDAQRISREPGINSRLDPVQAALLALRLPHLDAENARRRRIAATYRAALADLALAAPPAGIEAVDHLFPILITDRATVRQQLADAGIPTGVHYPLPIHHEPGYRHRVHLPVEGLPHATDLAGRTLSLPMHPALTDDEVRTVTERLRQAIPAP